MAELKKATRISDFFTAFYQHTCSQTTVISAHPSGCLYKSVPLFHFYHHPLSDTGICCCFSYVNRNILFCNFAFVKHHHIFPDFRFCLTDKTVLIPRTIPCASMYHTICHVSHLQSKYDRFLSFTIILCYKTVFISLFWNIFQVSS